MKGPSIWGQTVVRNEENFIWFAIMSVIDYLDRLIIYDLGSTDNTAKIIKTIKNAKIVFREFEGNQDLFVHANRRQQMLDETKGDWIFILDGDEIWLDESIKLVRETIDMDGDKWEGIVTPTKMLLGDIYHYQEENAGQYQIAGRRGHFNLRLINRHIPGLHIEIHQTDQGLWREAYYDQDGKLVYERCSSKILFLDAPYLHASHLVRSSKDDQVIERKMRYKYEWGIPFPKNFKFPSSFRQRRSSLIPDITKRRPVNYQLMALARSPLVYLKRKLTK